MRRATLALLFLLAATVASAQTLSNPRNVAWDYPPEDHERITRYELGYYLTGAADPYTTVDIAKASVTAEDPDSWRATLPRPAFGNFTARLRAHFTEAGGTAGVTQWSDPTGPFSLSPPIPAGLRTPQ